MHSFETQEQSEIRQSVRKLARSEIPKFQNEKFYNTVPRELFSAFSKIGLTGLSIDEKFGGLNASAQTLALVMEEIAAVDLGPAIFLSVHSMVSALISRFASTTQKQKYLSKLSSGEYLAAFALTEPSAGSDASNLKTRAQAKGDKFILDGEKCYISSAGFADIYLVFAKGTKADEISAFIIEANQQGMTINKPEKKMGAELSPIASINFSKAEIPADALLGQIGQGYSMALSGLARGRINIGACANGLSRSAIELTLSHLKTRQQFGKALIEMQGLQFMLADMYAKLEASRLLTWQAALTLDQDPDSHKNRLQPPLAKCFATDSAMQISTDAVQLLGGAGYVKEYQVERIMREAKMLQIVEGTNQIQRSVIARELAKQEQV